MLVCVTRSNIKRAAYIPQDEDDKVLLLVNIDERVL